MDGLVEPVTHEVLEGDDTRVNVHVQPSRGQGGVLPDVGLGVEHDGEEGVEGELGGSNPGGTQGTLEVPRKEGRVVRGDGETPVGDLVASLEGGVLAAAGNHLSLDDRPQRGELGSWTVKIHAYITCTHAHTPAHTHTHAHTPAHTLIPGS